MAIEAKFVYETSGQSGGSFPVAAGTAAEDNLVIIMVGAVSTSTSPTTISIAGFTRLAQETRYPRYPGQTRCSSWEIWWKLVPSGGSLAFTITLSGQYSWQFSAYKYRGHLDTPTPFCSPVDQTSTVATTSLTSNPVTLSVTATAVGAMYAQNDNSSYTGWPTWAPDDHGPGPSTPGGGNWFTLPSVGPGTVIRTWTPNDGRWASGDFLFTIRAAPDAPRAHCTEFIGTIGDVAASTNVELSVDSNLFPDALTNYRITFFANTTGHANPTSSLLSAGPWTIGSMSTGSSVSYRIVRVDGAHIDGSCVMRATDTTFGLTWDLTVQCPANPWGYNLSFGQRSGL